MGLISTDYKKEISLNEKEAELLYCPFKNEVLCDTIRCMSWVKVVNIHSSVDNMCPKGYVDLPQDEYQKLYDFAEIIPVSARKNDNTDRLLEVIKKYLPDNIKYFDDNTVTSSAPEFIISEFVREKVLDLTNEEVPHAVTCIVEQIEEYDDIMNISATVIVDRENLKKIIIGKNGSMIKEIGTRARRDIEAYFDKKVYLELFVKVIPKWRDKEKFLNMIGYKDFLNK